MIDKERIKARLKGVSVPVRTPLPKTSEQQKSAIKSIFLKIKDMK